MYLLITFGVIAFVFGILFTIYKIVRKKHCDFLYKNSLALKQLLEVNKKYNFYKCEDYNESHTYDNNIFFTNISCQDYLIYQLQYKKNSVLQDIKNVDDNKQKYERYLSEIEQIKSFANFYSEPKKLIKKYLIYLEKKLFKKLQLHPKIKFVINITLQCSKINGYVYDSKYECFEKEQILTLIKRLNNKNVYFYNDREIWNAICRVERGKVSNKMRFSIYERDGHRCCKCGRTGFFTDLEIDHIKPIAKGGKSTYDNLQTLCKRCNKLKGDKY